jgi:hypothetical protein
MRLLPPAILAFYFSVFISTSVLAQTGPRAAWGFEEGSGTTTSDGSGQGHSGTLTGGPSWVTSRIGSGLSFDGVDDKVVIPYGAAFDLTTTVTLSTWVKLPADVTQSTNPGT